MGQSSSAPNSAAIQPTQSRLARLHVVGFREAGVDVDALARRVGIDPAGLDQRLPTAQIAELYTLVTAAVGDSAFGLVSGTRARLELSGVVGHAMLTAATLGSALERNAGYRALIGYDRTEVRKGPGRTGFVVHQSDGDQPYAPCKLDADLAFMITFGRRFTGRPIVPERVLVRFSRPLHHARYAEILGCKVEFDAPDNEIVFRDADLALPLMSANSELCAIFREKADALLARGEGTPSIADRTRDAIRRLLRERLPSAAEVARVLAVSQRTLQRGLQQEETSFQELLDEVRLELARRYLRDQMLVDVSSRLGFSSLSSFYRAFKRWTGMTPEEYRCDLLLAGSEPSRAIPFKVTDLSG